MQVGSLPKLVVGVGCSPFPTRYMTFTVQDSFVDYTVDLMADERKRLLSPSCDKK